MEDNNLDKYGASGSTLSVWEKIKLFQDWYPVVTFAQAFLATPDAHQKAIVVSDCAEWLASKTRGTVIDDELVQHITAVLKSPQGESLLRWVIAKVQQA